MGLNVLCSKRQSIVISVMAMLSSPNGCEVLIKIFFWPGFLMPFSECVYGDTELYINH